MQLEPCRITDRGEPPGTTVSSAKRTPHRSTTVVQRMDGPVFREGYDYANDTELVRLLKFLGVNVSYYPIAQAIAKVEARNANIVGPINPNTSLAASSAYAVIDPVITQKYRHDSPGDIRNSIHVALKLWGGYLYEAYDFGDAATLQAFVELAAEIYFAGSNGTQLGERADYISYR